MASDRFDQRRLAAIYVGGVLGALARVGLAEAAPHGVGSWPWATFAANMAGALLLGLLVAAMRGHVAESPRFALLTTGLCGTLTTFATLQLELYEMLDAGHLTLAASYAAISIVGGLALVKLGAGAAGRGDFLAHMARKSPHGRDG